MRDRARDRAKKIERRAMRRFGSEPTGSTAAGDRAKKIERRAMRRFAADLDARSAGGELDT